MEANDKKARQLRRICRITHRGGRRAPGAVFDAAFMLAVVFVLFSLVLRPYFQSRAVSRAAALICAGLVFVVFAIVDRELLLRHEKKLRDKTRREIAENKLLLEPEKLLDRINESEGVIVIRKTDLMTADDIRDAARSARAGFTVVSLAEPTENAKRLISSLCCRAKVVTPQDYLDTDPNDVFPVSDEEIDAAILEKYGDLIKKPTFPKELFRIAKHRGAKYAAVGAALTLASLFVKYPLYYRIMGSAALSIAAWSFAADTARKVLSNKKRPG